MATSPVLNISALLEPIAGENPAGKDLRVGRQHGDAYDRIKEARRAAAREEKSPARPVQDPWSPISKLAPNVLTTESKDLEVASYLVEALVRTNGFAGLRDGFTLLRELIERFWDNLFPAADPDEPGEDPVTARLAPLRGLNGGDRDGTLVLPINFVPLVDGDPHPGRLMYDEAQAMVLLSSDAERQNRIESGSLTLETIEKLAFNTSPQAFETRLADLDASISAFESLTSAVALKCEQSGAEAPATSGIRAALHACREVLVTLAGDKLQTTTEGEKVGTMAVTPVVGNLPLNYVRPGGPTGPITSRDDAFARLSQVIEFMKSERHSLVVPLLEKAKRWAQMDVSDVLTEIIEDSNARTTAFKLAGIIAEKKE